MKKFKCFEWVSFVWTKMILLYFLLLFLILWHPCVSAQTTITIPTETSSLIENNDTYSYNNNNTTDFLNLLYETLEINSSTVIYNDEEIFAQEETFATTTTTTNLLDVYLNDDASVGLTKEILKKVINGTSTSNSGTIDLSMISKNLTTWPTKHVANVEGDIILGGLMMVHEREDTIICGPIMAQGGIQALETMLFTLDYINGVGLLPNISIGAHILDDCDKGKCFCRLCRFRCDDKKKHLFLLLF